MKKLITIWIGILVMGGVSLLALLLVSFLTYSFKWQADKAMLGITFSYIVAGFVGGLSMKWLPKLWNRRRVKNVPIIESATEGVGAKMIESILAGSIFMILLVILSVFFTVEEIQVSGRLILIWMLLSGSVALGRIL